MNMKKIFITLAIAIASITVVSADDFPVDFKKLPKAAQQFIKTNFPKDKVSFATVDDDIMYPEYQVALASGVMIEFKNDGRLESIKTRTGNIPGGIIPVQILEEVKTRYPEATVTEYEVGRYGYEVKLSNRLELKFNSSFKLVEIDD